MLILSAVCEALSTNFFDGDEAVGNRILINIRSIELVLFGLPPSSLIHRSDSLVLDCLYLK